MSMEYHEFKKKYNLSNRLESDRWIVGGTIRSCYGERKLTPEEPVIFKEFFEVLEQIDSSLSYIQCRNIEGECITKEYKDDRDWYGGTANYAMYVCDNELLYEELINRDII